MGICRNKPALSIFKDTDFIIHGMTSEMQEIGDHMLVSLSKSYFMIYTVYENGRIRFISNSAFMKCIYMFNLQRISNLKIHTIDGDRKIDRYLDDKSKYVCYINYLKQDVINYLKIVGKNK